MSAGLAERLRELDGMNIDALREEWRRSMDEEAPKLRAPDLLRRLLAERLQEQALGRDPELERRIAGLVHANLRGEKTRINKTAFRPGTILEREYGGKHYVVDVLDEGFGFNGRTWSSLSHIAREITGTRWNGPRFFGLREAEA